MIRSIVLISCSLVIFFTAEASGISCEEKREIIDTHNRMRQQVASGKLTGQPKASNMQKIVWDDDLADVAQNWANSMPSGHNPNPSDDRFEVGENLYAFWSDFSDESSNWSDALNSWFDEHTIYKFKPFNSEPNIGHYTQIVWADTMYVGCGFKVSRQDDFIYKHYVCNYGPAGNYLSQYPYKIGAGCENLCCNSQCGRLYGNQC